MSSGPGLTHCFLCRNSHALISLVKQMHTYPWFAPTPGRNIYWCDSLTDTFDLSISSLQAAKQCGPYLPSFHVCWPRNKSSTLHNIAYQAPDDNHCYRGRCCCCSPKRKSHQRRALTTVKLARFLTGTCSYILIKNHIVENYVSKEHKTIDIHWEIQNIHICQWKIAIFSPSNFQFLFQIRSSLCASSAFLA